LASCADGRESGLDKPRDLVADREDACSLTRGATGACGISSGTLQDAGGDFLAITS
jgi:hypothetical protein